MPQMWRKTGRAERKEWYVLRLQQLSEMQVYEKRFGG